jgi:hypothetical protein
MSVDLKWILILSMALAVLSFLVGAGSQFTDIGLSPAQAKALIALFVILLGCGNAINSVLVAFGMSPSNRLASAASVTGVTGIQVAPELVQEAKNAVGTDATITTTPKA